MMIETVKMSKIYIDFKSFLIMHAV